MPRNMSVTLTEQAVVERRKTVTRRLGWRFLKAGDRLNLCRKVMGRKRRCPNWETGVVGPCDLCDDTGYIVDPLVRLAEVEVIDVRRERLDAMTDDEVLLEGVDPDEPGRFRVWWSDDGQPPAEEWVRWFCREMGVTPNSEITRIEWRYLDQEAS